jgi:KaiC/GvpD/RAD55 family RecA-like ATPase
MRLKLKNVIQNGNDSAESEKDRTEAKRFLLDTLVSYQPLVTSQPTQNVPLVHALGIIKSGMINEKPVIKNLIENLRKTENPEDRKAIKLKLPSFTFSASFDKQRKQDHLMGITNIICFDFDNPENPHWLKNKISGYPWVLATFFSPNMGLKVLVTVKFKDDKQLKSAFDAVSTEFREELDIVPDPSGKDITRLCFASYDPELYLNMDFEYFEFDQQELTAPVNKAVLKPLNSDTWKIVDGLIKQIEARKVDITGRYERWLKIGFALTDEFGERGREFFHRVSQFYPTYDRKNTDSQFDHCLNNDGAGITIKSFFFYVNDAGIKLPPDIQIMKNMLVTLDEMLEKQKERGQMKFIWSSIAKGSFGFIFGPSKSGKTILCETLGMTLAAGGDKFLDLPVLEADHKVLYISLEEDENLRAERNVDQALYLRSQTGGVIGNKYQTVNNDFPKYITSEDHWKMLKYNIIESGANLVIIDSLTRMVSGEIENSTVAAEVARKLRNMTYELGITMIVIHHPTKTNDKILDINHLAGSRVLSQEADYLISVNRLSHNTKFFMEVVARYKGVDSSQHMFEINDMKWPVLLGPESEQPSDKTDKRYDDTNTEEVFNCIKRQCEANPDRQTFTSMIIDELFDKKKLMTKTTVFNQLKKLEEDGRVDKFGKGIYSIPSQATLK